MIDTAKDADSAGRHPSADEIRAALARILTSATFRTAGRSKDFLRFVVEETLAGHADRLKGRAIGVKVFGRSPGFDTRSDPRVRVEAGRLRRRLLEYYAREGAEEPIRIDLPRGGYAPSIAFEPAAPAGLAERAEPKRPGRSARTRVVVAAAVFGLCAIAAGTMFSLGWRRTPTSESVLPAAGETAGRSDSRTSPRLLVMPVSNLSDDPTLDAFGRGLTEEIIDGLVDFNVFSTASPPSDELESTELDALRRRFNVGYVLTASLRRGNGTLRVAVRLLDTVSGTQLWTRVFDESLTAADPVAVQQNIGLLLAEILSSPLGPVYDNEISLVAAKPATALDPYECLLRFYAYTRSFDRAVHSEAVHCMQRAVLVEPGYSAAWSALAVLYLHEWIFGYDPQPDRGPALGRARDAAARALEIDSSGRVSALAVAGIMLAAGDRDGFDRIAERALAAEPLHPAVAAQLGYFYVTAGDWQRGVQLLDGATDAMSEIPATVRVAYAFANLERRDYGQALRSALSIDSPNWFVAPMTMAATAGLAGRADIAQREAARLLELYPDFERDGREQLVRWNISADLRSTLLDGLRLAGLSIS